VFVRAAVKGVVMEAVLAACLTALMVLLFLGSWRSTLIIAISIPLSIIASLVILDALGETINLMTLGGLALAVGILVDDATVTIENINRHLEEGQEVEPAILKGSFEITIPALVSTLAICIVHIRGQTGLRVEDTAALVDHIEAAVREVIPENEIDSMVDNVGLPGATPLQAAHDAGFTRFRPVLMTALAMIIGMLPMSLGMGDGGEQNAPLGRAVIGGLIFATVATLVFVPTVFAAIHGRRRR